MKISPDLIDLFSPPNAGRFYRGTYFSKNEEEHVAVIIGIKSDKVFLYCLTSKKRTIDFFSKMDTPDAVVELNHSDVEDLFDNPKNTWIYCGKMNLSEMNKNIFLEKLSMGEIKLISENKPQLTERILVATKCSNTYSKMDLREMGIICDK